MSSQGRLGLDYSTAWARSRSMTWLRSVIYRILTQPVVALLAPVTVHHREALKDIKAPVIIVSNHESHLDTAVLMRALPARFRRKLVVGAAADYFFSSTRRSHLAALVVGAIPIERQKVNRRSATLALELLAQGWNLLLFPEGGRSPDGQLQPFKGGAAYLGVKGNIPVQVAFLSGTRAVLPKSGPDRISSRPHRHKTSVTFGPLLSPGDYSDARTFGSAIEAAVHELAT